MGTRKKTANGTSSPTQQPQVELYLSNSLHRYLRFFLPGRGEMSRAADGMNTDSDSPTVPVCIPLKCVTPHEPTPRGGACTPILSKNFLVNHCSFF